MIPRMSWHRVLFLLVVTALRGSAQAVENKTLHPYFFLCDRSDLTSVFQVSECKNPSEPVIAWPLFWFDGSGQAHSIKIAGCINAGSCGLDSQPEGGWHLGPVGKNETVALTHASLILTEPRQFADGSTKKDIASAVISTIERESVLVELSWRLGSGAATSRPLFELKQGKPEAAATVNLGDCSTLPIGEALVDATRWRIYSDCKIESTSVDTASATSAQNSASSPAGVPDQLVRVLAANGGHPFHWRLEAGSIGADAKQTKDASLRTALFPYILRQFKAGARTRQAVPAPADLGPNPTLVSVEMSFRMAIPPNRKQDGDFGRPASSSRMVVVLGLVMLSIVVGPYLVWLAIARRMQKVVSEPSLELVEDGRQKIDDRRESGGDRREVDSAPREVDDGLQSCEPSGGNSSVLDGAPAVTSDSVANDTFVALVSKVSELGEEVAKLKKLEDNQQALSEADIKTSEFLSILRQDAEQRDSTIKGIKESLKAVEDSAASMVAGLQGDLKEATRLTEETLKSSVTHMVEKTWTDFAEEHKHLSREEVGTALRSSESAHARPQLDISGKRLIEQIQGVCDFAFGLLEVWPPCGGPLAEPLGTGLFAASAREDYRAFRSIALSDRMYCYWCLGWQPKSVGSQAVLRALARDWLTGRQDQPLPAEAVAQFARRWADNRLPRIQTVIEAIPWEWADDDTFGIHAAIINRTREYFSDARRPNLGGRQQSSGAIRLDLAVGTLSDQFHKLATSLYAALDLVYVPIRLHTDTLDSEVVDRLHREVRTAVYPFKFSREFAERSKTARHGQIVRINSPVLRRPDRAAGKEVWSGSICFLDMPKDQHAHVKE